MHIKFSRQNVFKAENYYVTEDAILLAILLSAEWWMHCSWGHWRMRTRGRGGLSSTQGPYIGTTSVESEA
jgi:hypothetical protein